MSDLILLAVGMNVELHFKDSIIDEYKEACLEDHEKGHRLLSLDGGVCVFGGNISLHTVEVS